MNTVTFPGSYNSLESISNFVEKAATEAGLDTKAIYAVQLAVDEACCNIIDHAYGGEGIGDIQCSINIGNDELTIILVDRGKPYSPEKIPDPKLDIPLSKVKPRGVGLYLIRMMMDKVSYESTPDSTNVLTMIKRRG
jgi:serine/threonine-protein kinase RsbW